MLLIANYTIREIIRSKILFGMFILMMIVALTTFIASSFTYGATGKVAIDFALGLSHLANLLMAVFLGVRLIANEVEQKTIYMALSKPIQRSHFLMGKLIGLAFIMLLNTLIVSMVGIIIYLLNDGVLNNLIIFSILFSFIEALLLMILAVLFSAITNATLSVIFTISIWCMGQVIGEALSNFFTKINIYFDSMTKIASFIIPQFYRFNIRDFVVYQSTIETTYLINTVLYGLVYGIAQLSLLIFLFNNKNLE